MKMFYKQKVSIEYEIIVAAEDIAAANRGEGIVCDGGPTMAYKIISTETYQGPVEKYAWVNKG